MDKILKINSGVSWNTIITKGIRVNIFRVLLETNAVGCFEEMHGGNFFLGGAEVCSVQRLTISDFIWIHVHFEEVFSNR